MRRRHANWGAFSDEATRVLILIVAEQKRQGRSVGTMKNRTAHLRWWAERIGRPGVVPSNGALGIANREYVTNEDKSVVLDPDKLTLVKDEHVCVFHVIVATHFTSKLPPISPESCH